VSVWVFDQPAALLFRVGVGITVGAGTGAQADKESKNKINKSLISVTS
jgi:hypothetical protein